MPNFKTGKTQEHYPLDEDSDISDEDLKASGTSLTGPQVLYPKNFAKAVIKVYGYSAEL